MAQDMTMRRYLIPIALLALTLTACGGSDDGSEDAATTPSTPSTSASSSAPTEEPTGESTDCLLSATKFADRAGDHAIKFASTAPAFGETEDLSDLDDLQSEVSVLCSSTVVQSVADIMVPLSEANYEIAKCAFDPDPDLGGCKKPQNDKVHGLGEDAASLIGDLRTLLEA
jgi:hypothetical protein